MTQDDESQPDPSGPTQPLPIAAVRLSAAVARLEDSLERWTTRYQSSALSGAGMSTAKHDQAAHLDRIDAELTETIKAVQRVLAPERGET